MCSLVQYTPYLTTPVSPFHGEPAQPSPSLTAGGSPAYQLQVNPRLSSRASEDEQGTKRWYRQAKETKCGETDGKESERLVVPMSQGNQPVGPWGGKGT